VIAPAEEQRWLAALRAYRASARDEALRELFEMLRRPLFQLCVRVTGDANDAEDALQETFFDVWRGLAGFRGEARLSTWIFRIAIRAALRVRSRRVRREGTHDTLDPAHAAGPHHETDPRARAEQRENAARLLAAIDRLPAAQRAVLALAAVEGLQPAEIAEILGVTAAAVHSRLFAARARLRAELAATRR
jgi:RNA polymerase sigma-70 factor (ECF subfamily)